MTPGTYTARLLVNGWTTLATSSPVTVQMPTLTGSITATPMTVSAGTPITVTANGPGGVNDWVGLVEANSPDSSYIAWQYLNGSTSLPATGLTSATLQFVAPMTPGTYTARLFTNGWTELATSDPVTVQAQTLTISITATPMTVSSGAPITVTVNGPGRVNDWVGLVEAGSPDTSYIAWQYLDGSTSLPATGLTTATLQFVAPMTPGTYTARLFTNGWTRIATSTPITVQNPSALTISISPTPTVNPGGSITVTLANGPGNFNDWVGLVEASAPDTSYIAWQYLNGATSLPATGLTSATLQFVAPMTPGTYTARLLVNGWTRLATSNPVIVPASVMLSWDANTDANIAGYKVYVGTKSRAYSYWVDVGNITSCTVDGLPPRNVYYVAVTAYDQSGAESDFSNEVSVAK
jgi:hypothetical protein